jgi:WD40 repeat protein
VIDWAVGDASSRLTRSADRASAERSNLRVAEADLAATVAEIELARERARIHGLEAGRSGEGIHRSAPVCPFKGLATFDPADADFFFGREQLISELVARSVGAPFVGVVGPSGSGKSSAVRAGLMPALAGGALPGSEGWSQTLMRPGTHPMEEIDRVAGRSGRSLLVVDQFEETFTACSDEHERAAFVDAITTGGEDRIVVAAIRADFYGRCAEFPALARLVGATHVLVGPMAEAELRRAIELPARRAGLRVEPALVAALIAEVADRPGALPLLSTTLLELWQLRDGRTLTLQSYLETGGVSAAVARLAEDAYARLSPQQQIVARAVLLRLAGTQTGDAVVRRRVPLTELDVERDPDVAEVLTVLADARMVTVSEGSVEVAHEALLREWPRLRGWLEEDVQGRQLHHHLIEAAREWSEGGEDPADLYRGARLASAMDWTAQHTFELNEQERNFLEHSREATVAESERAHRMNRRLKGSLAAVAVFLVISLVGASLALHQRTRARHETTIAESKRLAAEAVAETDLHRSVDLALAGLALDNSVDTRGALLKVLQSNPSAIGLTPSTAGLAGVATTPDGQTLVTERQDGSLAFFDAATRTMQGDPVPVMDVGTDGTLAMDPAGRTVAFAGEIGSQNAIGFVNARDRTISKPVDFWHSPLMDLAYSRDGDHLAVASSDFQPDPTSLSRLVNRWVQVIDPKGRTTAFFLVGKIDLARAKSNDPRWSSSIASLPGGRVAVSWFDGGTTIWDVEKREPQPVGSSFPVGGPAIAASNDGGTLAVGQVNGSVSFIDVRTGRVRTSVAHHDGPVTDAVFTPDGSTVFTTSSDGEVDEWDAASASLLAQFQGSGELAISPDGGTLYASGSDSEFATWDLRGEHGLSSSRDIKADEPWFGVDTAHGLVAYVAAGDPSDPVPRIGIWDPANGALSYVSSLEGQRCSPAMAPDGNRLLLACDGGAQRTPRNVAIVDLADGDRRVIPSGGGATWDGTFSPHGRLFATVSDGYTPAEDVRANNSVVTVRDASTLDQVRPGFLLNGTAEAHNGLAFSPDDRLIAAATGSPPHIEVWDVTSGRLVASPGATDRVQANSLAFSPDGRTLAIALANGSIRILDTSTWADAIPPISASADSLAFSPDGSSLAVLDGGRVSLLDAASGRRLGDEYPGPMTGSVGTIQFLLDGRLVLLVKGQPAFIYRADLASWKAQACSIVGEMTPTDWERMAPDQPYRAVCAP